MFTQLTLLILHDTLYNMATVSQIKKEKKIVQYIQKYHKKGYSSAEIKDGLLKSGVKKAAIKRSMKVAHTKQPFYMNKTFWIVLGFIIFALLPALTVIVL